MNYSPKLAYLSLCLLFLQQFGFAQTMRQETWLTNGKVNVISHLDDKIYLGGEFSYVGPYTGPVAIVDSRNAAISRFPDITGEVRTIIADGAGGWFVGGKFTEVAGVRKLGIAHILADMSLDPNWTAEGNIIEVYTMVLDGDRLLVGANGLLCLDKKTGAATNWKPTVNGLVRDIVVENNYIAIGGTFSAVGSTARQGVAFFNKTDKALLPLHVKVESSTDSRLVQDLLIKGDTLFIAGAFSRVDGIERNGFAAYSISKAALIDWNPVPYQVNTMALLGDKLLLGAMWPMVEAVDLKSGQRLNWLQAKLEEIPFLTEVESSSQAINNIRVDDSKTVYISGRFKATYGGTQESHNLLIVAQDGTVTGRQYSTNHLVHNIYPTANGFISYGFFGSFGGVSRKFFASLDAATGVANALAPELNAPVYAIQPEKDVIYIGGTFTQVNGQDRKAFAAMDPQGNLLSHKVAFDENSAIKTIYRQAEHLLLGGAFQLFEGDKIYTTNLMQALYAG